MKKRLVCFFLETILETDAELIVGTTTDMEI